MIILDQCTCGRMLTPRSNGGTWNENWFRKDVEVWYVCIICERLPEYCKCKPIDSEHSFIYHHT